MDKKSKTILSVLALGHGVTDLYANFLPALLPIFEENFSLSKTLIGVLISAVGISGSLSQVVYGYVGDRWNSRRILLVPGPAVAAVFMCFIGLSPSFLILLILLLIGGMGVSAFHPSAASFAGDIAGSKRGFGLSLFMAGGTIGYAAGPMSAAALILLVGPAKMPLACVVGLITSILLYRYAVPQLSLQKHRVVHSSINILKAVRPQLGLLTLLCVIVILKATVSIVFVNFMSFLIKQRGFSLIVVGVLLFLFLLPTALGTLFGGRLSDRMSRKALLLFSLLLSSPLLFCLVYVKGIALVIFVILSGVMTGLSNPVPLAIAQEVLPENVSIVSSLMMGLSWGIGALMVLFFGVISDYFGGDVAPAMAIAAFLPVVAAIFVLPLSHSR